MFHEFQCTLRFIGLLTAVSPASSFNSPDWIPRNAGPNVEVGRGVARTTLNARRRPPNRRRKGTPVIGDMHHPLGVPLALEVKHGAVGSLRTHLPLGALLALEAKHGLSLIHI